MDHCQFLANLMMAESRKSKTAYSAGDGYDSTTNSYSIGSIPASTVV